MNTDFENLSTEIMHLKRTKMVCTIGPATDSEHNLEKLVHIGMNVARLNFSHGTYEEFHRIITDLRAISEKYRKPVGIIQDLQGPKIRVGKLEEPLEVVSNSLFYIGVNAPDDKKTIPIQYNFIPFLQKDHILYFNDAYLKAKVVSVSQEYACIQFSNEGIIISNKGINIPDTVLLDSKLTEKDIKDLEFGIKEDVDYIALSFVQTAELITSVRSILSSSGKGDIKIIVKVETKEALKNIDEIIQEADVIMIARGDLAVEVGMETVPMYQLEIIEKCKERNTPVIVATQMLESMIWNPLPTRAEVNDVANATMAHVDAVMLSAESAVGKYPFSAVEMMRSIIKTTENGIRLMKKQKVEYKIKEGSANPDAIAAAATLLANQTHADLLVVATKSGKSAHAISSLKPSIPIIAITQDQKVYNQLSLVWGVRSFMINVSITAIDDLIDASIEILKHKQFIKPGSKIIFVTGLHVGVEGETNSVRILNIEK